MFVFWGPLLCLGLVPAEEESSPRNRPGEPAGTWFSRRAEPEGGRGDFLRTLSRRPSQNQQEG